LTGQLYESVQPAVGKWTSGLHRLSNCQIGN
jgi:hypothetical protein